MKKFLAVCLIIAVASSVAMFAAGGREAEPTSAKIGFIGPMTGDYANYGDLISKGALVAIEEKNATGGIAGKIPVELIIEEIGRAHV